MSGHTKKKASRPKRLSIRKLMFDRTAPSTTIARFGFGSEVRSLMRQAYLVGLNNGKLLGSKSDEDVAK